MLVVSPGSRVTSSVFLVLKETGPPSCPRKAVACLTWRIVSSVVFVTSTLTSSRISPSESGGLSLNSVTSIIRRFLWLLIALSKCITPKTGCLKSDLSSQLPLSKNFKFTLFYFRVLVIIELSSSLTFY